jgi:putative peptidoglycan lipid II flippase
VRELVGGVSGTLGAVVLGLSVLGVLIAPLIIFAFAPGFTQQQGKFEMAAEMLRWTFPYLFFISLTALFSGVLNSYGRFAIPAFTQVIMNVVMIVTTLWIAADARNPGLVLAIGVFVSGALQVLFQLPSVARLGLLSWPRWRPAMEGVRRIGRLMIPGIFGSSMAQVNLLLESVIASFLVNGSIAWLYYADRIMEFQHRPGHGDFTGLVVAPRHRGQREIFRDARLVAAPGDCVSRAGCDRIANIGGSFGSNDFRLWAHAAGR